MKTAPQTPRTRQLAIRHTRRRPGQTFLPAIFVEEILESEERRLRRLDRRMLFMRIIVSLSILIVFQLSGGAVAVAIGAGIYLLACLLSLQRSFAGARWLMAGMDLTVLVLIRAAGWPTPIIGPDVTFLLGLTISTFLFVAYEDSLLVRGLSTAALSLLALWELEALLSAAGLWHRFPLNGPFTGALALAYGAVLAWAALLATRVLHEQSVRSSVEFLTRVERAIGMARSGSRIRK